MDTIVRYVQKKMYFYKFEKIYIHCVHYILDCNYRKNYFSRSKIQTGVYTNFFSKHIFYILSPTLHFASTVHHSLFFFITGVDYLKHVPIMFKAFGLKRSGWASLFFEVITNPSKLTSIKHLIPLIFSNITRTFRNYIMNQNWKDLKLLMDEKQIWYTTIAGNVSKMLSSKSCHL